MSIEPDPHARQSPVRVAVVEPDPAHAELTVIALEREGHEVRRAIDSAGLGDLLAEFDADVIVSEWALAQTVPDRFMGAARRRGGLTGLRIARRRRHRYGRQLTRAHIPLSPMGRGGGDVLAQAARIPPGS